ncbi:toprim domain-containing protein [Salinimicrobium sp. TH3]|uniref:toprim domain-containing protein n=1 Tax=Salinimicrobium sp. TH3 TaxID=2997342 RepID=UPI0022760BBE|nr:toprim domain-containing protein [Salinimicrobium sp. TH3]MCY2685923.1 toprim domain-containing protein [Salinimicrobium sp. TH3]
MKTKKMNCETARNICIIKTLENLGHFPSRKTEKEAWFLSPLRKETKASFKISFRLNRWYDFGIGKGGNVIDLVCLILNCSVAEALAYLSDGIPVSNSPLNSQVRTSGIEPSNRVLEILPIEHKMLKKYLQIRNIPVEVAKVYCKEIWYISNGKRFFALGLKNHLGGWELRNLYFKTSTPPKSYSYLSKGKEHLTVLEGMFDLLSLAIINPEEVENADLLILNSLSFLPEVLVIFTHYSTVTLYLDRDSAGIKATENILRIIPNCKDGSSLCAGHKDLNEKLVNGTHDRKYKPLKTKSG